MNDDATLLRRYACQGDQAAFAELVHRHLGWMFSIALRRAAGDRQLAEEVVQTAFTALARESDRFAAGRPIAPWLHRTVLFASAKAVRREARHRKRLARLMKEADPMCAPQEAENLAPVLDEMLDRAREGERSLIMMRFFEHRSIAEAARCLGITEDAARKREDRALERLRCGLERRGIRSTAAAISALLAADGLGAAPAGMAGAVSASAMQVAGALAPFAALVQLMNAKTAVAALAALICLGGIAGWHESQRARAAETGAGHEEQALEAILRQTAARLESGHKAALSPSSVGSVKSDAEKAMARRVREGKLVMYSNVLKDEDYRRAFLGLVRANQALFWAPWFQLGGLDAGRAQRAVDAQAEAVARQMDLQMAAKQLGLNEDSMAYLSCLNDLISQNREQISAILGPALYADFARIEEASPDYGAVQQLAGALYDGSVPLSATQVTQLTAAVMQHDTNAVPGGEDWRYDGIDWPTVNNVAAGILTGPQAAVWSDVVTTVKWQAEYTRAVNGRK